jgi:hypothetical protein
MDGSLTAEEASSWVLNQIVSDERGCLGLDAEHEQLIFDVLVQLIVNEDEPFRMGNSEIAKLIHELEKSIGKPTKHTGCSSQD